MLLLNCAVLPKLRPCARRSRCAERNFKMILTITPPEETALQAHLQKLRTQLHEDPELSWQEHRTTRLVRRELEALCLEPVPLCLPTGTAALLRGALPGPTVGLRADLDALPITERTGAEFYSRVPGVMHACGHDIHMAALLGAARLLAARREQLAGNVLFLFQPAEEAATGAMQVLEQGLFRRVPMAGMLALHVWPGLAQGQLGIRSGAILSAVDSFEITVTGRGGHGSAPERACNPIPAGAALASALTTLRANDLPQAEPAVTAVTCIQAGTCNNVIPDRCILLGTIRTFSARTRAQAKARLEALTAGIAAAWGCTAAVGWTDGTPALCNDAGLAAAMEHAAVSVFGKSGCVQIEPQMISEDFACYGSEVPICCAPARRRQPGGPAQRRVLSGLLRSAPRRPLSCGKRMERAGGRPCLSMRSFLL